MSSTIVWDRYWAKQNAAPSKDDAMCLFLAIILNDRLHEHAMPTSARVIEMGAGSGRTSRYLNFMGHSTSILDISEEALALAKFANEGVPNHSEFIRADLLSDVPLTKTYDIAWNAGVLEHFEPKQQTQILSTMMNSVNEHGLVILLTPYRDCVLYRIGKWVLETIGKFPYGAEIPVATLKPVAPITLQLADAEVSLGFTILLFNAFKALSNVPLLGKLADVIHQSINRFVVAALNKPTSRHFILQWDARLSKWFGGYLLLSIFQKTPSSSRPLSKA